MPKDKPPNPIFEWLSRGGGWPSMKQAPWLAIGLVLACTVFLAWLPSVLYYRPLHNSLILPSGLVAISPVFLTVYAVILADRLITGFDHKMIQLTPLTESDILDGFTLSVLFRLRVPRVIVTGLAPFAALLFTTELGWYMPVYVERLLTVFIGFAFAVEVWVIQRISIFFAVNAIYLGQPRLLALLTTGLAVLMVVTLLYFVTGLAAFALSVWVTLMTTVVF